MTVVFAGGGTGGHLYPAIAIADALRRTGAEIRFVGTADRLEATIVPRAGYALSTIASRPLQRKLSPAIFATIATNLKGTLQSFSLLGRLRPDVVVATGGYVCFPVMLAARVRRALRLSRAPLVLLEPNAAPGLTNRLLAPIVDEVWNSVPIRSSLRELPPREQAMERLGLDPALRTVVAMGGSQGARTINDALVGLMQAHAMPAGWQLFALTGEGEYDRVRAALPHAAPYLEDMADVYAAADLVIARAGASTLGELATLGKPSILIPYPYAAEAHQASNAARFERAGAAVVLTDAQVQQGALAPALAQSTQPQRLRALAEAAAALGSDDPLDAILMRVAALVARKSER